MGWFQNTPNIVCRGERHCALLICQGHTLYNDVQKMHMCLCVTVYKVHDDMCSNQNSDGQMDTQIKQFKYMYTCTCICSLSRDEKDLI